MLEIFLTPQWESLIYDIYIGVMTCIVLRRQFLGQTVSFGFALCSGHNDLNLLFNVHMGEKNPSRKVPTRHLAEILDVFERSRGRKTQGIVTESTGMEPCQRKATESEMGIP